MDLIDKDVLINQIQNSDLEVINGMNYVSIKFRLREDVGIFSHPVRIPVEMIALQPHKHPVSFLLHVVNGVVDELEVYTLDGTEIDSDISLCDVKHEVAEMLRK